ncbi:unnamed protein product [Boreogadus saida]
MTTEGHKIEQTPQEEEPGCLISKALKKLSCHNASQYPQQETPFGRLEIRNATYQLGGTAGHCNSLCAHACGCVCDFIIECVPSFSECCSLDSVGTVRPAF